MCLDISHQRLWWSPCYQALRSSTVWSCNTSSSSSSSSSSNINHYVHENQNNTLYLFMQGQRMLTGFLWDHCCSFAWVFIYALAPRMQPTCTSQPLCVCTYIYIHYVDCHFCLLVLQGNREFRALFSSFHLSFLISYIGRHVVVGYRTTLQLILHTATRT
jgi:hypothetical protein